jgi:hypothetical protein
LLALAATPVMAAALACGSGSGDPDAAVVTVLGHWESTLEDGIPTVVADARRWDGKPPADIAALGQRLFGVARPELTANVSSSGAFPLAIFENVRSFEGGTLRVDFKLIGGESDQIAGLAFDVQPTGEYLYVRYNTRDDNVALWRFANGQRDVIVHGERHRRLDLNAWHTLTLTVNGRAVEAVAAGDLVVTHTLDRPVTGRAGVWTKRDSVTAFRQWRTQ